MIEATLWILLAAGGVFVAMALLLLVQALGSLREPADLRQSSSDPDYVVLIPAHDEALVIEGTVRAAAAQLGARGRLLVVADNCSDDTAARARAAGAEVVERNDPGLRAKGYALAHGIAYLEAHGSPQVVIMMDADCRCTPGSFDVLSRQAHAEARPVQAINLMLPPAGAGLKVRMAAFAWAFRNVARMRGLAAFGLSCQLFGTGMAIPWFLLRGVGFASAAIAEDLQLGLQFAANGAAPVLSTSARVESEFASSDRGLQSQRRRWEHGHLQTILSRAPKLLWFALRKRSPGLLALVLDMAVPPLALFAALLGAYTCVVAGLAMADLATGAVVAAALLASCSFALAVIVGWWQVGRQWIGLGELLTAPLYIARKIPMYFGFIKGRQTEWIRTHRGL